MRLKENKQKQEIKFEEVYNGTLFECKDNRGTFYIKGCNKQSGKTDGIYAVNIATGVVSQPLMEENTEKRESFNHLFIYPFATFELKGRKPYVRDK